jgi:hypothetical protein
VDLTRGHRRACLLAAALTGLTAATAALLPSKSTAAPGFRAFSDTSPWNVPAAAKGPIDPGNPFAGQFAGERGWTMKLSGTPDNPTYASPVYFAQPGDPVASVNVTIPDWAPQGSIRWDGLPVPVPAGVKPAPGSDGHLTVVSADRRTAWEFWRCTKAGTSGYSTAIIVQFDLTGPGYSDNVGDTSARGSGAPLISTTLRAEEALDGIPHALGITVPHVGSKPIYPPMTHTDGEGPDNGIQYGMLFVLRADYPIPANASVGVRNVIAALKTYGAYVIDQGADLEMDADSTHPEQWQRAGLNETSFGITANDFRLVHAGPVPFVRQPARPRAKPALVLRANSRSVWAGGKLRLRGKAKQAFAGARVRIQVRTKGHWRRLRRKPVEADGTFGTNPRLGRYAHVSRSSRNGRLHLENVRLHLGIRVLKFRATVKGLGHSNVVRVRVRR